MHLDAVLCVWRAHACCLGKYLPREISHIRVWVITVRGSDWIVTLKKDTQSLANAPVAELRSADWSDGNLYKVAIHLKGYRVSLRAGLEDKHRIASGAFHFLAIDHHIAKAPGVDTCYDVHNATRHIES